MKTVIIVCVLGLAAFVLARPGDTDEDREHYTDKYDNIDLDEILGNRNLLVAYIKCILELGKCTPDGKELKSHIADALANNCAKCTPAQKEGTKKVIKYIAKHEAEYWTQLKAKYDPKGVYEQTHAEDLKDL